MSASALLSITAPVAAQPASTAPQGTDGGDASSFKGLLATVLDGDAAPADTPADKPVRGPKDKGDEVAAQGFLSPPAPAPLQTPTSLVVANADGASATEAVAEAAPPSPGTPVEPPPPTAGPAPADAKSGEIGAAGTDAKAMTKSDTLAAADALAKSALKAALPAAPRAPVQAAANDQSLIKSVEVAPTVTPSPQTAVADVVVTAASAVVAAGKASAEPEAVDSTKPTPTASPPGAPTSSPLRALAERTSRPIDDSKSRGDFTGADSAKPASSGAASAAAASVPDQPVKPAEATPAAGRDLLATDAAVAPDETTQAAPAPADAQQAQAHAAVRETSLSSLARGTIEATAQIAAQIVRKLEGRSTRFEMALTPDDLGRVDVKLDIDADGRLAARLAFDNPLAATDLKGRADELRRQLQDAGFTLADNALDFAERDSSSSAFDRGADARDGQNRAFAAASRRNAEIDVAQPPRWTALSLSPSGVDMKV